MEIYRKLKKINDSKEMTKLLVAEMFFGSGVFTYIARESLSQGYHYTFLFYLVIAVMIILGLHYMRRL